MKVLIIGHLPVATQNNMGITFLSLFSRFQREELCQLYIYPAYPDVDRCASFYRVTDKEVLSSLVKFRRPGGPVDPALIRPSQGLYEVAEDESFYRSRKNKSALRRLLRDGMWKLSRWYSPQLKAWLREQKPDCIFIAPGVAKFIYDITLRIAKKENIPIVTYICDEYYFVNRPKEWMDRLRLKLLQGKIKKLVTASEHLVVICDELKQAYGQGFGVPTTTLMTGTATPVTKAPRAIPQPRSICYFGNIRCNRYLSLAQIGRVLDGINGEQGTDYSLKIYTSEKDPDILGTFQNIRSIRLEGFLTGDAFRQAFDRAELLLHVEAFDEASIDYVRHSVSTKIGDSLGSGIPLLAYGPEEVSSMAHLLRHRCALTACSEDALKPMLLKAFSDEAARTETVEQALKTARQLHSSEENGRRLRQIVEAAVSARK